MYAWGSKAIFLGPNLSLTALFVRTYWILQQHLVVGILQLVSCVICRFGYLSCRTWVVSISPAEPVQEIGMALGMQAFLLGACTLCNNANWTLGKLTFLLSMGTKVQCCVLTCDDAAALQPP